MAELLYFLVDVLFSGILDGLAQGVFDLLFDRLFGDAIERQRRADPVLMSIGLALVGGLTGWAVTVLVPTRLFPPSTMPGVSLILSPIVCGLLMEYYGVWRVRRGAPSRFTATFWGGASFALGFAAARFWLVA